LPQQDRLNLFTAAILMETAGYSVRRGMPEALAV